MFVPHLDNDPKANSGFASMGPVARGFFLGLFVAMAILTVAFFFV